MLEVTRPQWFDTRLSIGNLLTIGTFLVALVAGWTMVRADVADLKASREEMRNDLREVRRDRATDREALMEMRGDIRVIRSLLERRDERPQPLR